MLRRGVRRGWLIKALKRDRRTVEWRDTAASAGEGEERRRVKVHAERQKAGCSSSHEKGKFTRIYFADTINFLPPFQRRKQEIKK